MCTSRELYPEEACIYEGYLREGSIFYKLDSTFMHRMYELVLKNGLREVLSNVNKEYGRVQTAVYKALFLLSFDKFSSLLERYPGKYIDEVEGKYLMECVCMTGVLKGVEALPAKELLAKAYEILKADEELSEKVLQKVRSVPLESTTNAAT